MSSARSSGARRLFATLFSPRYLLLTNTAICTGLYPFGDVLSQLVEHMLSDGPEESARVEHTAASPQQPNTPNLSHARHRAIAHHEPHSKRSREGADRLVVYEKLRGLQACTRRPTRSDSPSGARGRHWAQRYTHAHPSIENAVHEGWPGRGPLRSIPPTHSLANKEGAAATGKPKNTEASDNGFNFDKQRTRVVGQVGLAVGLFNHVFYQSLERFVGHGRGARVVLTKIVVDQIVASTVTDSLFLFGVPFFEGEGFRESWSQLRTHLPNVYMLDLCYWPLAQAINFLLLPSRLRVLWVAANQFCWNAILSFYVSRMRDAAAAEDEEDEEEEPTGDALVL